MWIGGFQLSAELYARVKRQTARQIDHGQTELSNMLVKKSVLNEINKVGTFTQGLKDWRKVKEQSLVVSDFRSETKGSWFEFVCYLWAEVSSLQ